MRLAGREQAQRRFVLAVIVRRNQIDGMGVVELVVLILSVDHRHIPTEQVDEEAFAISEDGLKQGLADWRQMVVDNVDHGVVPCGGSHARGESRSCGSDRAGIYRKEEHKYELQSLMSSSYAA